MKGSFQACDVNVNQKEENKINCQGFMKNPLSFNIARIPVTARLWRHT